MTLAPPGVSLPILKHFPMQTLRERLDWIMAERGWTANRWCTLAGIDRDTIRQAYARAKRGSDVSMSADVLTKLAVTADLSLDWLILGRGSPSISVDPEPDRYPSRALAVAGARSSQLPDEAIRRVRMIDHLPQDPGKAYWWQLIMAEVAALDAKSSPPSGTSKKRNRR